MGLVSDKKDGLPATIITDLGSLPDTTDRTMKLLLLLLLVMGVAHAQRPTGPVRCDSLPQVFPPARMPNIRPGNAFYQLPSDPKHVVRATLDNMPVKVPEASVEYTMLQSYPRYPKPAPSLPVLPQLQLPPPTVPGKR
ncbi:hypothetical protein HNV11_09530 [Spirosoma taeanense]|uniref:Uncharacterized protein n=1 Tax=Spirosoma taeanense TaxID=2735870 RepID=A0A6M5Y8A8_9BACT|nr:hypothetical protein [Spirosoma taeanense]QJW89606.1 hypothetical protein HNV11_09530 [Spirosoma taeanense]